MNFLKGCVYLSTLTLTSIAIDRFFVIIFPFRPRMKICTCLLILLLIWIFAILLTFPYGYYMKISDMSVDGVMVALCDESWPTEDNRWAWGENLLNIFEFLWMTDGKITLNFLCVHFHSLFPLRTWFSVVTCLCIHSIHFLKHSTIFNEVFS